MAHMECKRKIDGRKLDRRAKEALRLRVIEQVRSGASPETLARVLDINPRTVYRWLAKFHYGGKDALKAKPIPGRPPKLSGEQMSWIASTVREKNPLQLQFPYALWTLAMIRELIRTRFNVRLSEVSVGRVMRTLGFTPQRPLHRAYQQDPVLVEKWRTEEYPKIQKQAKKEKALIFFADESGIRSDYHKGHTWAPEGKTPVVEATGARFSLNIHALGGQCPGAVPLHGARGYRHGRDLLHLPQATGARHGPEDLPDRGRAPDSPGEEGAEAAHGARGEDHLVLPATLLTAAQSRRAGVGPSQAACGQAAGQIQGRSQSTGDCGIALFAEVAAENTGVLPDAIMSIRLCAMKTWLSLCRT